MDPSDSIDVEVLLPVHNEAETIEGTIREIYDELSRTVRMRFIICEDGSSDATKEILNSLCTRFPMKLMLSESRKGYSRAVRDGMKALDAPYLLCLDSDGQCDPKDFWKPWEVRADFDVLTGWRVHRADSLLRRLFSRTFYFLYQSFFHVPVHDPSCPYILARKQVIDRIGPDVMEMQQGFWWEFVARVHRCGFSIKEIPINHRPRAGGATQVYRIRKMPGIFLRHCLALVKIWNQTRGHHEPRPAAAMETHDAGTL